jgi:hypothetical protein
MKTIITLMLFASITAHAQPSIDFGLNSRICGTIKVAVEKQTGWNNTEIGVRTSFDNWHPITGIQTGYSTTNQFQYSNFRFQVGGFWHTAIMEPGKVEREQCFRLGGSVRMELNHGLVNLEWNGETINFTLGFIFKSRYQ